MSARHVLALLLLSGCATEREEEKTAAPTPAPAAATAPSPAQTPDADFRAKKPAALPLKLSYAPPVPEERDLPNGLRLLVAENHALPLVAVDLLFFAGTDVEPRGQAGLADFSSSLLLEGTPKLDAAAFAEARDELAAEMRATSMPDGTRLHLSCTKEVLVQALQLFAEAAIHPAFRPADVERIRQAKLTAIEARLGNPGALARDALYRSLFGDKHPWGAPPVGTTASVKALNRAQLVAFHDTWLVPNNAVIAVAGDLTPAEAADVVTQAFGAWKKRPLPLRKPLPAGPPLARSIFLVDKPYASQSQLMVVGPLFPAKDPDAVPMQVANRIIGGLFSARLNMNLREQKGYSYGVFSTLWLSRSTGLFQAFGLIHAEHTAEAVLEVEKELERFKNGQVTAEELGVAKEAYERQLPQMLGTDDDLASAMTTLLLDDLPLDEYRTLPVRIRAVDATRVASAIRRSFHGELWPVALVGPRAASEDKLKALGFGAVTPRQPQEVETVGP